MKTQLSLVIPCYNEAKRIKSTLQRVEAYCKKRFKRYEIILVDDGSTDNTVEVALKAFPAARVIKNARNKGKGFSINRGMLAARYDLVLFTDADLSTPIKFLDDMLLYTNKAPIIIASRNLESSRIVVKQNPIRQILGKTFPLLNRIILGSPIRDTQCGFKLFSKKIVRDLFSRQKISGFAFDAEILFLAKKLGYPIIEIAVDWYNSDESKVHMISDPFKMLIDLFRIRLYFWCGKYKL